MNRIRAALKRLKQRSPSRPAVVPANLAEAIGIETDLWSEHVQLAIRARLKAAADLEWATTALRAFDRDPDGFLRRYNEAELERATTAVAIWSALADLMRQTRTRWSPSSRRRSFEKALASAGLTEREWLASVGLTFDAIDNYTARVAAESAAPDASGGKEITT
jgi:hypothetical protein